MADLAERVGAQGGNVNRILSDAHAEAGDVHQLNCTYYSALGDDDERYLAARAIQLFARGFRRSTTSACWPARTTMPRWSARGRAARSTATTTPGTRSTGALQLSVVRRFVDLVRLRNTHPAFVGDLLVDAANDHSIRLRWQANDDALVLDVDFEEGTAVVTDRDRAESLSRWVTSVGPAAV